MRTYSFAGTTLHESALKQCALFLRTYKSQRYVEVSTATKRGLPLETYPLNPPLFPHKQVRAVPIRKDDEVRVMRGFFATKVGRVTSVYRKKFVVHVERCENSKKNGAFLMLLLAAYADCNTWHKHSSPSTSISSLFFFFSQARPPVLALHRAIVKLLSLGVWTQAAQICSSARQRERLISRRALWSMIRDACVLENILLVVKYNKIK